MEQDAIQHRLRNPEYGHGAGPSLGNAVIGARRLAEPAAEPAAAGAAAARPHLGVPDGAGRAGAAQPVRGRAAPLAAECVGDAPRARQVRQPRPELRSVVAESLHWVDADAARQFRDPSRDASPALPRESRPHPLGPEAANGGDTVAMEMFQGGIKKDYPAAVPERNPDGEPYPLPVGPPIKSYSGMRIFEPASRAREAYILRPQSQERRPPWPPNGASGYHASIRVYPQPGPTKVSDATGLDGGLQRVEGRSRRRGARAVGQRPPRVAGVAGEAAPRPPRPPPLVGDAERVPAHEGEVDRALFSGQWGEEDPEMRAAAQAHADQWNASPAAPAAAATRRTPPTRRRRRRPRAAPRRARRSCASPHCTRRR